MYRLKLKHSFDAAHKLKLDYSSPCLNLHGHKWFVEVLIEALELNVNGMIIDFKQLKGVINQLDHQFINEIVDFNPTAENISKYLYEQIIKEVPNSKVEITVWESPDASITYTL